MKNLSTTLLLLWACVAATVQAQPVASTPATAPSSVAKVMEKTAMKDAAEAEVKKIDKDAKKITLKHGPIKNLDMPGMTMVFQVKDSALLDKLAVGDKILFTAEDQKGAMVVTQAEKMTAK